MNKLLLVCLVVGMGCTNSGSPSCGDGVLDTGEACDDGNNSGGDGCTSTCDVEPYCGDGILDSDEDCDDGNNANGDLCSSTCEVTPGCGDGNVDAGEQCDDGDSDPSDGCSATCQTEVTHLTQADWRFFEVAAPLVDLNCPPGAETAAVHSQALRADGTPAGTEIIDLFTCSNEMGTTAPLFQGRWRTHIAFTNNAGTSTFATSVPEIVDLTTTDGAYLTAVVVDGGYFHATWSLKGAVSMNPLTCAQVPLEDGISFLSTIAGGGTVVDDLRDCEDGFLYTEALPPGTYTISVSILNTSQLAIGTAPTLTNKVIQAPNIVTEIGNVEIPVDGL